LHASGKERDEYKAMMDIRIISREKAKYLERNFHQHRFFHHKSEMGCPEIEVWHPLREPGAKCRIKEIRLLSMGQGQREV
jgi:hypothetical protein